MTSISLELLTRTESNDASDEDEEELFYFHPETSALMTERTLATGIQHVAAISPGRFINLIECSTVQTVPCGPGAKARMEDLDRGTYSMNKMAPSHRQ